jgi:hypothetical protein
MRISVALCTYNGERFLSSQLESFAKQTRLPDELVVCDDRSTDGTLSILQDFAKRAPFPVRITQNLTTLRSTKNFERAIGLCNGDLIATSDQDDVWLCEKLAVSEAEFIQNGRLGLVFTNAELVDEELHPLGQRLWDTTYFSRSARRRVRNGHAFEVLLRQWLVTGATMTFRSDLREFVLPIPDNWIHDGWIAFLIGAMAPIACVEQPTIQYRQHSTQQIGARKLTWKETYRLAHEVGPAHFRLAYERYSLAHERLCELTIRLMEPSFVNLVERKVAHQERRLAIAECTSRLRRILWSLDELLRGGYGHFSPRWSHSIKDMLF